LRFAVEPDIRIPRQAIEGETCRDGDSEVSSASAMMVKGNRIWHRAADLSFQITAAAQISSDVDSEANSSRRLPTLNIWATRFVPRVCRHYDSRASEMTRETLTAFVDQSTTEKILTGR